MFFFVRVYILLAESWPWQRSMGLEILIEWLLIFASFFISAANFLFSWLIFLLLMFLLSFSSSFMANRISSSGVDLVGGWYVVYGSADIRASRFKGSLMMNLNFTLLREIIWIVINSGCSIYTKFVPVYDHPRENFPMHSLQLVGRVAVNFVDQEGTFISILQFPRQVIGHYILQVSQHHHVANVEWRFVFPRVGIKKFVDLFFLSFLCFENMGVCFLVNCSPIAFDYTKHLEYFLVIFLIREAMEVTGLLPIFINKWRSRITTVQHFET